MNSTVREILHIFCIWCAASILVCLIIYMVYHLIIQSCWKVCQRAEDNATQDTFDDVIEVVRALQSTKDSDSMVNNCSYVLELEGEYHEPKDISLNDYDIEANNLSVSSVRRKTLATLSSGDIADSEDNDDSVETNPYDLTSWTPPSSASESVVVKRIIVKPFSGQS